MMQGPGKKKERKKYYYRKMAGMRWQEINQGKFQTFVIQ